MPHPTPSPVAAALERHASPPPSPFVCTDAASLLGLVERVAVSEKERVLQLLGADYCEKFNTVGFGCQQGRPVQILSPYALEPGPERRAFLEALVERQAKGTVDTMPYLVYWFDASLAADTPKITLEPRDSIWSYEQGEAQGYDTLPKQITKKMAKKETLTKEEQLLCDALGAMEIANDSGAAAVAPPPPDHVLYKVVHTAGEPQPPEFPTPRSMEKKKQTAANALLEMNRAHDKAAEGLPQLGDRVRVFWEGENEWYYGTIDQVRESFYFIHYDDDEEQWLPLAEHVFAVVPPGENGEATPETESKDSNWSSPRRTPRCVPARKCKTESAKKNKKKQQRSKRAADDGETEWNDTELTEKPKKKKKKQQQQAIKSPVKQKKKKEAVPESSLTGSKQVFRDGFFYPTKTPKQDDKGFFKRPAGRGPSGFTWDRRNARFKPTSEPLVGNKKRKEDAYEDHAFEKLPSKNTGKAKKRRVKEPVASDDDGDSWLGETALTMNDNRCKEEKDAKEQPFKIPRRKSPPPEAGQTSAEKGPTDAAVAKPKLEVADGVKSETSNQENDSSSNNNNNPEATERDAKKLQKLLPLSKDADAEEVEQVRAVLLALNRAKASVPRDISQSLYKPVRKLRKHPQLGELACSLIKKYRDAALGETINDWSQAVAEEDTEGTQQKIKELYASLTGGKKPLDLDQALVEQHNLRDLVLVTSMFFADEGVSLTELTTLEGLLGESATLEDTAEV